MLLALGSLHCRRCCCCCPRSASGSDPAWPSRWSSVGHRRRSSSGGRPTTTPAGSAGGRRPATHRLGRAARAGVGVALVLIGGAAILVGPADLDGTARRAGGRARRRRRAGAGEQPVVGADGARPRAERSARIREQERAEVAAHVHDSVLHTLTLIQRHADDPREVARLARAQERELRGWLYRPRDRPDAATSPAALERVAAEVEDAHGVADRGRRRRRLPARRARSRALLQAAREALVNAAKYAGGARRLGLRRGRAGAGHRLRPGPRAGLRPGRRPRGPAGSATVGRRPDGAQRRHRRGPQRRRRGHRGGAGDAEEHAVTDERDRRPTSPTRPPERRCGSSSSTTTGCSAPACGPSCGDAGRGRRRGRGRRAGGRGDHRDPARRGAARRAPARRRRPGGAAGAGRRAAGRAVPRAVGVATRPRTSSG